MILLLAIVCGFLLDLLLADPSWMPHPVIFMGRCITWLESFLRKIFPKTPGGERLAGLVLAILLPLGTLALSGGICLLAATIHPLLFFAVNTLWCWQCLALRGLWDEGHNVARCLISGDLSASRRAVGRIVGRDTQQLTPRGITKATVETIAENYSDGVLAPLFYLVIGGAPLGLCYKAINTMDSMVGYKNQRYLHFGRYAAHLDDLANFIPARLGALLWICAAPLVGQNGGNAWRIWRRDRRNHASPNSAQTESACAGALGIQLAGPAYYFGQRYDKPYIGDPIRPIETADIPRSSRTLVVASLLGLTLFCFIRGCFLWL